MTNLVYLLESLDLKNLENYDIKEVEAIRDKTYLLLYFVLGGYEHCVANMFYIPAGIFAASEYSLASDGLNWGSFFIKNLLPVTLGNIIGGAVLVACGYWFAYLTKNKDDKKKTK